MLGRSALHVAAAGKPGGGSSGGARPPPPPGGRPQRVAGAPTDAGLSGGGSRQRYGGGGSSGGRGGGPDDRGGGRWGSSGGRGGSSSGGRGGSGSGGRGGGPEGGGGRWGSSGGRGGASSSGSASRGGASRGGASSSGSASRGGASRGGASSRPAPPAAPRARDVLLKRPPPAPAGDAAAPAERAPPAPLALAGVSDPTFVPRDPAVRDGPWSAVDAGLVVAAQADSAAAAAPQRVDAAGYVLLGKTPAELGALAQQLGQPAFRGQQLADGVLKGARSVAEIRGLPEAFRDQLAALGVRTGRSAVHHSVSSPDGTRKLLLQVEDGRLIETVGIPVEDGARRRLTVCVSSQVGCPMRCNFCATGKGGFARNLKPHEIVDQVLTIGEVFGQRVSNVVFMGQGEPMLNLPGVVAAVRVLQDQLGLSGRAITISTVGVPNALPRLAEARLTATLAVSIHAPSQALREALIPSARTYPIEALMADCAAYFKSTGRRVTFEYTLMGGTNDTDDHARALAKLLRAHDLASHVNLIPWNPVKDSSYERPGPGRVKAFQAALEAAGLAVSVRSTRGLEAAAACGQLRNDFQRSAIDAPVPLL
ncbi:rlmN [Scenedesmus sp. PABB004]|nr:rlmN [Scenedesmus sp. PABB004]